MGKRALVYSIDSSLVAARIAVAGLKVVVQISIDHRVVVPPLLMIQGGFFFELLVEEFVCNDLNFHIFG